jgi:hypothetical protein
MLVAAATMMSVAISTAISVNPPSVEIHSVFPQKGGYAGGNELTINGANFLRDGIEGMCLLSVEIISATRLHEHNNKRFFRSSVTPRRSYLARFIVAR